MLAKRCCYAGALAVLVVALTLFPQWVAASPHVQPVCSVPGGYGTIQAAVDDPGCMIVYLGAGTFYESVTIARTVTLQGQGQDLTIIDLGNPTGSLRIRHGGIATLSGIAIQSNQSMGSAIWNDGTLTVTDSTLRDNHSVFGWGGGAIYNRGTLSLINSTLTGNDATSNLMAQVSAYGGAICNEGTLTVINSTLNGNSASGIVEAPGYGGAISNHGALIVINSTLSGNSADEGGAVHNLGTMIVINSTLSGNSDGIQNAPSGTVQVTDSIIANSSNGADCSGPITSLGHNIDSDGSCGLDPSRGDLPNADPLLGPLQDGGGATLTHTLLKGSLAIDAGSDICPATDQRGMPRPVDGDRDGVARCDIGAVELAGSYSLFLPVAAR